MKITSVIHGTKFQGDFVELREGQHTHFIGCVFCSVSFHGGGTAEFTQCSLTGCSGLKGFSLNQCKVQKSMGGHNLMTGGDSRTGLEGITIRPGDRRLEPRNPGKNFLTPRKVMWLALESIFALVCLGELIFG